MGEYLQLKQNTANDKDGFQNRSGLKTPPKTIFAAIPKS
jgi:hypothetical protein